MKAIIFDMDGLMIDTEGLYFEAERDIAKAFKKTIKDETLWKMMGKNPIEGMEIFVKDLELPIMPQEAVHLRNELMRQKMKNDLKALPGLSHIIDSFFGRLKLAVSTGAQKEFLDIALDRLGIRNKFLVLQTSDEIIHGKPEPEIFFKTCAKLGLAPHECIVLEDSENGVKAGHRTGCYVIAVPSQYTCKQDFYFADFIASDLYHAAEHIKTLLTAGPRKHSTLGRSNES